MLRNPQDTLAMTHLWFAKAVPEPADLNIHTQIGVHFEEVAEMVAAITPMTASAKTVLDHAHTALEDLANLLKGSTDKIMIHPGDRVEFLDAICDQLVTATGSAHMLGMDPVGGLAEVNRSNFSKFDDQGEPIFNENRKIMKSQNYSEPDLTDFVA